MKTHPWLIAVLLALPAWSRAENPFLESPAIAPAPAGGGYLLLEEHLLVPAARLDPWLDAHPGIHRNALPLREEIQRWIEAGEAFHSYSGLTAGTFGSGGSSYFARSSVEQIYPTEYLDAPPEDWPLPSAFELRNLGHEIRVAESRIEGEPVLAIETGFARLVGNRAWNAVIERTREADDVHLPEFRAIRFNQRTRLAPGQAVADDPFADPATQAARPAGPERPGGFALLVPGCVLIGRVDPLEFHATDDGLTRVVITRTEALPPLAGEPPPAPQSITFRIVRVPQPAWGAWVLERGLSAARLEAWETLAPWLADGSATKVEEISAAARIGTTTTIENLVEFIYPTEWEPSHIMPAGAAEEAPPRRGPSTGTAFETRNTGLTIEAELHEQGGGWQLKALIDRVRFLRFSVMSRIEVENQWQPDILMPLFASQYWFAESPLPHGRWVWIAGGADLETDGMALAHQSLLVFARIE